MCSKRLSCWWASRKRPVLGKWHFARRVSSGQTLSRHNRWWWRNRHHHGPASNRLASSKCGRFSDAGVVTGGQQTSQSTKLHSRYSHNAKAKRRIRHEKRRLREGETLFRRSEEKGP